MNAANLQDCVHCHSRGQEVEHEGRRGHDTDARSPANDASLSLWERAGVRGFAGRGLSPFVESAEQNGTVPFSAPARSCAPRWCSHFGFWRLPPSLSRPRGRTYDVVVYGGTSGGVAAAVQTARMGKSVVVIEPGRHIGGLTSGGLGATDIGNKQAIGGISREFYQRVLKHYSQPDALEVRRLATTIATTAAKPDDDTMWTFEPHVAEAIFREMLAEAKVPVHFGQRLDRKAGVAARRRDGSCRSRMETGRSLSRPRCSSTPATKAI